MADPRIRLDDLTSDDLDQLYAERDQYAAAIRYLLRTVRHTAYVWQTTLPDTIRTADVVLALSGIASHVPHRPELRDDLWQRIVGAYYVRFESEGHPEDSQAAADEAMAVVRPELEQRDAQIAELRSVLEEVLRQFVHRTHPGEACLQSDHVPVATVAAWRAVLYPPPAACSCGHPQPADPVGQSATCPTHTTPTATEEPR